MILLTIISILVAFILRKIYKFLTFSEYIKISEAKPGLEFSHRFSECPQPFPNGWLPVLESIKLKTSEVKSVFAFGKQLVVFRGISGKVRVFDAYCPHLGANIGIGGTVVGEGIRCPFHGWQFASDGKCSHVPGIGDSVPNAQLKAWDCTEVNGFIFVWHHLDGHKPQWDLKPMSELESGNWVYRGKSEHTYHCHFQDLVENGADDAHFDYVHKALDWMGTLIDKVPFYDWLIQRMYTTVENDWNPCPPPDTHCTQIDVKIDWNIFGFNVMTTTSRILRVGPAMANITADCGLSQVTLVLAIISDGPFTHRMLFHLYTKPGIIPFFVSKYGIYFTSKTVESDIVILDNKKYLSKPILNTSDRSIKAFRRWFAQFYSNQENNDSNLI